MSIKGFTITESDGLFVCGLHHTVLGVFSTLKEAVRFCWDLSEYKIPA